ncbi:MAG: matrixin family metalloprotease [Candidatus Eremiobacteraeota bacterium]|nr:matrixin family metalloprotease [Candidatus Eremiobacteraeota bacterium]
MNTFSYENRTGHPLRRLLLSLITQTMVFLLFMSAVPAAAQADTSASSALPGGFEVLRQYGRPCRLQGQSPLLIYSNDDRFRQVFLYAIESWNNAARSLGMAPLFAGAGSLSEADVTLDWSGKGLPPYAAGGVWWYSGDEVERVKGITMEPNTRIPEGNLAEILMQELGHVIGLGHSQDSGDIMYQAMHRHRYPSLSSVHLTQRDMQAFAWLYSQQAFVPILGIRQAQ